MTGLPEGLRLRPVRLDDVSALAEFNADVHREEADGPPDATLAAWTRDLLLQPPPDFLPEDMLLIEDQATGRIVSTLGVIPQTWTYDGMPFRLGRVELVGTAPEYRRRGLTRHLMHAIHARSRERGHHVQGITGIPWFYRQFGYEMTVGLDGRRGGYAENVPPLGAGEIEPVAVRAATETDAPFLARVEAAARPRSRLGCVRDEALWRYELTGRSPESTVRVSVGIVERLDGVPVGYLVYQSTMITGWFVVRAAELDPATGTTWPGVAQSVLRFGVADATSAAQATEGGRFHGYWFVLAEDHPLFQASPSYFPEHRRPYGWYLRVEDVPAFLRHLAPALERRLAASSLAGYTGEVRIDCYRRALLLRFEQGRLTEAAAEPPSASPIGRRRATGLFPDHTFLHLVFGHRSVDELQHVYSDCLVGQDPARLLLDTLFPKQPSQVWGWA